jgi:putative sigma-54 modulation protein
MNITIGGQTSDALNELVHKRLTAALGQHESWIDRVAVRLTDENGPRGGEDKICRMEIHLRGTPPVFIEQRGRDFYILIDEAADRAKQVVGRKVAKKREKVA